MPPDELSPAERQAALLSLITGRTVGARAAQPTSLIVSDARANAYERLAVYGYMYRARIVEALEAQFPRLARHLGGEAFASVAAAYVADEPSTRPSLRNLGQRLPAWLAARHPDDPTLPALARLEWARDDVFDLEDQPLLTMDALREWPADRFGELPLTLVTAHRLLTVGAGAARLWDAIGAGASDLPTSPEGAESLVVWREGIVVYHRVLGADERGALELAADGTWFGVVCERLAGALGADAAVARAFEWLSTWVADGLLVGAL